MPRLRPLRARGARPRRGILAKLGSVALYLSLAIAFLAVAAATFLFIAAPTDLVRDQIVAQVKARTGRTLTISGPASFTLFPTAGVRMSDVTLSAPPGMEAAPLMKVKRLAVDVRLMPLLQREIVIDRLVLGEPVFELAVDARGRRSWDFADAQDRAPAPLVRYAQAGGRGARTDAVPPELKDFARNATNPGQLQTANGLAGLEDLVLADVRIEGGMVRYTDQRNGLRQELRAINAEVGLRTLASPLEVKGTVVWQGETLQVASRLQTLKSLVDGRPARLVASISGRPLEASYDGTLSQRDAVELEGKLAVKAASVRMLAAWLGRDLPASAGFGPASLAGILKAAGPAASLDAMVLTLDGATSTGTVAVDAAGAVPLVKANVRMSELDLGKYQASGAAPSTAKGGVAPIARPSTPAVAVSPAQAPASQAPAPASIEDLIERSAADSPQVRGFTQRDGWSNEPIDFGALALVDAEARITIDKLISETVRVDGAQLGVLLKSRNLRLNIDDSRLYDGCAKGFVTVDGSRSAVAANLQIEGIAAQPLLKSVASFDGLAGKGRISLALAGLGKSEREIVESLNGRADLSVADGAVVGWNIPQMIRGLGQGNFTGFDRVASERTDFSELTATFHIANGIASNTDLKLTSTHLRVAGAGTIALPARRIDYTVRPKLVTGQPGAGGADIAGFEIPVKIQGPWDRPSYAPDIQGVLRDPAQAADAVRRLGDQIDKKVPGARQLIDQLFNKR